MPDAFDPYFKWLGIPKADQPPHGYRLLGIETFESDADVISNAADGRMAQVKSFQAGKYGAISQKLLNEIAAAKVCLLNPQKKVEYDRRLKAYLQQKSAAAKIQTAEPLVEEAQLADDDGNNAAADGGLGGFQFLQNSGPATAASTRSAKATSTRSLKTASSRSGKKASRPAWFLPAGVGAGAVALVAAGVAIMSFAGDGKGKSANTETASAGSGERDSHPAQAAKASEKPAAVAGGSSGNPARGTSTTIAKKSPSSTAVNLTSGTESVSSGSVSADDKALAAVNNPPIGPEHGPDRGSAEVGNDILASGDPVKGPPVADSSADNGNTEKSTEKSKSKKTPAPDDASYQETRGKIKKLFQKEFAEAKTPESILALAAKLDEQGGASKEPVERYSCWRFAAEGACAAGEFSSGMDILDKVHAEFDFNADAVKAELLAKGAARTSLSPEAAHKLCEAAMKLADAAVAREDMEAADKFVRQATTAVKRVKDPQFSHDVQAKGREIEHLKAKYAVVAKALETLQGDADNADANLTVGQWQCFTKGNWEKGLPYLVKCGRDDLAELAKRELAKPTAVKDQVAVADAWWALSEKEHGDYKPKFQTRAVEWYTQAAPALSGLEKLRVEKQIAAAKPEPSAESHAAAGSPPARSFGPRGTVQKGNVALRANGATVTGAKEYPDTMLLPDSKLPPTRAPSPCEFVITLDKSYQLQHIRFLLWGNSDASYTIFVSRDGKKFDLLQDCSKAKMTGWQEFPFHARPVKAIKISCTRSSLTDFLVCTFEAYCYPNGGDGPAKPGRGK